MRTEVHILLSVLCLWLFAKDASAILCYQCDSNEDETCPADRPFDPAMNAVVECGGFEAHVPGTFCMKIYRESSGWYGWVKITRRCGSRTQTGVAWGCRWFYDDSGVFREVCYCDTNYCNSSSKFKLSTLIMSASLIGGLLVKRLWLD